MSAGEQRRKRNRIVLLGWYGSDNTGDEAVLEAIVAALRTRGCSDLHALSIDPQKTRQSLGIASSPRNLSSRATLRALRGAKALVLGGGGLIQDRTSVYNLPLYALYVLMSRLFGLQVVGWGLGVEPLDTLLGKALARFIVNSSERFSVRDAQSKAILVKAGVHPGRVTVSTDPAFLIKPEPDGTALPERHRPGIVFCLRDLPNNRPGLNPDYLLPISLRRRLGRGNRGLEERTEAFVQALARGVRLCALEFGAEVNFLSLWPGRDDEMAHRVIEAAARLGVSRDDMLLTPHSDRPAEVAARIASADLLVSMRLHALIFAATAGVPSLALAYARKMRGLMRALGMERWVIEVETRTPSPEEVEMKLRLLWDARLEARNRLHSTASQARTRAEQDAAEAVDALER